MLIKPKFGMKEHTTGLLSRAKFGPGEQRGTLPNKREYLTLYYLTFWVSSHRLLSTEAILVLSQFSSLM